MRTASQAAGQAYAALFVICFSLYSEIVYFVVNDLQQVRKVQQSAARVHMKLCALWRPYRQLFIRRVKIYT